jgi:hypothetical protein
MKISEALEAIKICMENKLPVHLWGAPGIGKSSVCKQLSELAKRDFIDLRMSMLAPTDVRGLPSEGIENGEKVLQWLRPDCFPKKGSNAVLLLDELNLAPISTQHSAYQLVLDRKSGKYNLPEGVDIVAAGNRGTDQAYTNDMPAPLRNRFVHIDIDVDLDEWKNWAMQAAVAPEVISFLNFKPSMLFQFDPKKHDKGFPTPRSWDFISRLVKSLGKNATDKVELLKGVVGEGAAIEFASFLRVCNKLPDAAVVIEQGKMTVEMKDEMDIKIAFCGALVNLTTRTKNKLQGVKNLLKFCTARLSSELAVLTFKDYARTESFKSNYADVVNSKEWDAFTKKFGKIILA